MSESLELQLKTLCPTHLHGLDMSESLESKLIRDRALDACRFVPRNLHLLSVDLRTRSTSPAPARHPRRPPSNTPPRGGSRRVPPWSKIAGASSLPAPLSTCPPASRPSATTRVGPPRCDLLPRVQGVNGEVLGAEMRRRMVGRDHHRSVVCSNRRRSGRPEPDIGQEVAQPSCLAHRGRESVVLSFGR